MRTSLWLVSALCALAAAAPTKTYSTEEPQPYAEMEALGAYFEALASKIQAGKGAAPVCDLSKAVLPVTSPSLPPPSAGLKVKHVAIGRGTQNYTCGADQTAAPVAIGALATLYNASCVASAHPDVLSMMPRVALQFNLTGANQLSLSPSDLQMSGHHYFEAAVPTFNLDTTSGDIGIVPTAKNSSSPAPANASVGQYGKGFGAVPWLKLLAADGTTGNIQEVYRVNTAGGNPPKTCAGMPAAFEVQYSAEYWFYES